MVSREVPKGLLDLTQAESRKPQPQRDCSSDTVCSTALVRPVVLLEKVGAPGTLCCYEGSQLSDDSIVEDLAVHLR